MQERFISSVSSKSLRKFKTVQLQLLFFLILFFFIWSAKDFLSGIEKHTDSKDTDRNNPLQSRGEFGMSKP